MASLASSTVAPRRGPAQEIIHGGEGPALVWLHGPKVSTKDDPLLQSLAAAYAVTAPVMPGQKSLEELDDLPTLYDLVLLYDSVLDDLGLERVFLVGHSFGAMLAAELAALAPRRVRGLALISPLGLWNDAYPVEDLFARPYSEIDTFLWSGAAARPRADVAAVGGIEDQLALVNALGSIAKYTWPIPERGLRGRLYRVAAPTLLLFARSDALLPPAYAKDFASALADSQVRTLNGGHMAPYEDPAAIAELVHGFFQELT